MFKFIDILLSKKLWDGRSKVYFTLITFLLLLLWKFQCVTWLWGFSPLNGTLEPDSQKLLDDRNFESLYSIVETVSPAIAWRPVVFHILPNTSSGLKPGRSTFWGRAMNEMEIIALSIQHIEKDVYKAEFKPSFGGLYRVVIYLTYVNGEQFQYTRHVSARMVNITGSPFFLQVQGRPPPENIARFCSQAESGTAQGRWVKCGALRGIQR